MNVSKAKKGVLMVSLALILFFLMGFFPASGLVSKSHSIQLTRFPLPTNNLIALRFTNFVQASSLTIESPIDIDGNSEFLAEARNRGWQGNGTIDDPIVIANVHITSPDSLTPAIRIKNTDLYFVITNSKFSTTSSSVPISLLEFQNVSHCQVINNTMIDGGKTGILVAPGSIDIQLINNTLINFENAFKIGYLADKNVTNILISGNQVTNNTGDHVMAIANVKNGTIKNNILTSNPSHAINIVHGYHLSIMNNIIKNNGKRGNSMRGISIYGSYDVVIHDNYIENNFHNFIGIQIGLSSNIIVKHNFISGKQHVFGIQLNGASSDKNILIQNNMIMYSDGPGIMISGFTNNTVVKENDLIDNNVSLDEQIDDQHTFEYQDTMNSYNITYLENFYDDHDNIDEDNDGIADQPYEIKGLKEDTRPRSHPINVQYFNKHVLTKPKITNPHENDNFAVNHQVTFTWKAPEYDSDGHGITSYSLYYRDVYADNEDSWIEVVSSLKETSYAWTIPPTLENKEIYVMVVATCNTGYSSRDIIYITVFGAGDITQEPTDYTHLTSESTETTFDENSDTMSTPGYELLAILPMLTIISITIMRRRKAPVTRGNPTRTRFLSLQRTERQQHHG